MNPTIEAFNRERSEHWDRVASLLDHWNGWGGYYQKRVTEIYQFNIPSGSDVMEVGCGSGNLLAGLRPKLGLGLDISEGMVGRAKAQHPNLEFQISDSIHFNTRKKYDFVVISDTVNDLWDVQATLTASSRCLKTEGRLIINFYSRLWELPLKIATRLHLAKPTLLQNWLTPDDARNLLDLAGYEVIRHWEEVLLPLPIPLFAPLCNKYLVRFWPFRMLAMTHFMVARKKPEHKQKYSGQAYKVSVIVPARNEEGNIKNIFSRVPRMGSETEIIFIEGHSTDHTFEEIKSQIKNHPYWKASLFRQEGKGKGNAVRLGFSKAKGDVLMILDADLTMPPEYLPRFYDALTQRIGDFINGVRLVYPMEKKAMRFFNLLGNKAFSILFSYILGQPIKDTLCGTKVLWKKDYEKIAVSRSYFGDFDPFGDYDLIFGAAKQNLKIVDMPIRYQERTYGDTNIQRWKHGWLLLRMVNFAARRLKFI